MKRYAIIIATLLATIIGSSCTPDATQTVFSLDEQTKAAEALVGRVTGGRQSDFKVVITEKQLDGHDYFALWAEDDKVVLEGGDGVGVASALNHYLQEWCGCHISWCGSNVELPEELPLPTERVVKTTPYKYRYCFNYCTFNYTMSWWDKERWQWEIDFMALNGINMPLAVTGQNSVWQRVYKKLGFTDKELESFFSGPAYFNWFWMGINEHIRIAVFDMLDARYRHAGMIGKYLPILPMGHKAIVFFYQQYIQTVLMNELSNAFVVSCNHRNFQLIGKCLCIIGKAQIVFASSFACCNGPIIHDRCLV